MEVDQEVSLTALIHPVSMLIISNHFTRMALVNDGKFVPVVGVLLGKQSSRTIEIQNCFEVEIKLESDGWKVNSEHLESREKMYQETFPNQSFLGFYVAGDHQNIDEFDKYLYNYATSHSDIAVVLLKMSPLVDPTSDKIPVNVFESTFDRESAQQILSPAKMKIVSEAGEQISTDHAAKFTSGGDKSETTAAKKLNEQAGALKMLWKGLTMLMEYLKAVEENKLPADTDVMRELNKLAIKLDFLQKQTIKSKSANGSLNDNLIVLLTMTNKVSGSMFAIIGKLNSIINEHKVHSHNPMQHMIMKRKESYFI